MLAATPTAAMTSPAATTTRSDGTIADFAWSMSAAAAAAPSAASSSSGGRNADALLPPSYLQQQMPAWVAPLSLDADETLDSGVDDLPPLDSLREAHAASVASTAIPASAVFRAPVPPTQPRKGAFSAPAPSFAPPARPIAPGLAASTVLVFAPRPVQAESIFNAMSAHGPLLALPSPLTDSPNTWEVVFVDPEHARAALLTGTFFIGNIPVGVTSPPTYSVGSASSSSAAAPVAQRTDRAAGAHRHSIGSAWAATSPVTQPPALNQVPRIPTATALFKSAANDRSVPASQSTLGRITTTFVPEWLTSAVGSIF
ncbi:hypothetical protein BC828DRAFT_389495 [Blastocladiella britannica]|nr:hypothetical protein BC828DRAFT_389495 [Blastocladiella britannica]